MTLATDSSPMRTSASSVPAPMCGVPVKNGGVDLAGAVLIGAVGRDTTGIHVKVVELLHGVYVANRTVHHDAGDAAQAAVANHELTKARAARVATSVDYDYVARLGKVHGNVEKEVVARRDLNGKGSAQQRAAVDGRNS